MSKPQTAKAASQPLQDKEDGHGDDLTTVLNKDQRAELTLLIAKITESMRNLIEDNFNAAAGLDRGLLRDTMTEEEKIMSADPSTADVSAYESERKLKEQYEKDLATPAMKNLKKNALGAFDEWRENVLQRVGQVVNSGETAKDQIRKASTSGNVAKPEALDTKPRGSIVRTPAQRSGDVKFKDLFTPTKTPLTKLSMKQRTLVLHSLLLLLLSLEHYNAFSRTMLLHVTASLKLPLKTLEQDELTTTKGLLEAAKEMTADEETKKRIEANKDSRKWKVGFATVAGAALIGVSGGLAAPLVATGVGSIMGGLGLGATAAAGYLGTVAGSTVVVGGLFGAYGGRMTGQMMDNYAREVEDFEFVPVHSRKKTPEDEKEAAQKATENNHRLRVMICVSGWLTENDEVVKPWKVLGDGAEIFALKYELEALLNLGNSINGFVQSAAWGYAQSTLIKQTIFADLMAAMWPIGLIKAARVIDNPFSVAKNRANKAGEVLADALIDRAQGERPVTLIGYSLGARVIYRCLLSLAKRKAFGLIETAVLIGAPTPSDTHDWRVLRSVVSGRLVNVYSENDYVLGFMYRTSSIQYGVAGLQKIERLPGVENVNVTENVDGHLRYRFLVGSILKKIGFEDIDINAVEEEQALLKKMIEEEKKNSLQAQRKRLLRRQSAGLTEDEAREADEEADDIQKQVAAATEQSLVTRAVQYFYAPNTSSAKDVDKAAANVQKAAENPSDLAAVASDTAKDAQASTASYAQWVTRSLPSLPGRGGKAPDATKIADDPSKAAADADRTVTDVTKDPSKTAADATEKATVQSATDKIPSAADAQKLAPTAAASSQSYTQRAVGYLPALPSITGRGKSTAPSNKAGESATDVAKDAAQGSAPAVSKTAQTATDTSQTYTSKASSYLPSLPNFGRSTAPTKASKPKKPSEADDAASEAPTPLRPSSDVNDQAPKVDRVPSGIQSPSKSKLPKLDEAPSSGKPSTTPKLERVSSDAKKSVPKLDRVASGVKSPVNPTKLDRSLSGLTSSIPTFEQLPEPIKSKPKLDKTELPAPSTPKLDKIKSGPVPKLGERRPSDVKSPSPTPKQDRTKSRSVAKLDRSASGVKSPSAALKSPPLKAQTTGALDSLKGSAGDPVGTAAGAANKVKQSASDPTSTVTNASTTAKASADAPLKSVTSGVTKMKDNAPAAPTPVSDTTKKAKENAKDPVGTATGAARKAKESASDPVGTASSSVATAKAGAAATQGSVGNAATKVKENAPAVPESISNATSQAQESLGSGTEAVATAGSTPINTVNEGVTSGVRTGANAATAAANMMQEGGGAGLRTLGNGATKARQGVGAGLGKLGGGFGLGR